MEMWAPLEVCTLLTSVDLYEWGAPHTHLQVVTQYKSWPFISSAQQVETCAGSGGVSGVDAVRIFDTAAMTTSVQPLYAFRWSYVSLCSCNRLSSACTGG